MTRSFVHGETYTDCQKYYTLKLVVDNQPFLFLLLHLFFFNKKIILNLKMLND